MRKYTSVEEYLKAAPKKASEYLQEVRKILKGAAPEATETLKWGMPAFVQERILFSYAAFSSHLNFIPTRSTLEAFKEELKEYTTGRDAVQFPYDKPLPVELIKKIAEYRVKEVQEGSLWKHKG